MSDFPIRKLVPDAPAMPLLPDALDDKAKWHPVGLIIDDTINDRELFRLGNALSYMGKGYQWWIGDYIKAAERKWGETYTQFMDALGIAYQSAANTAWVAGSVPFSLRRETLSWSHHKEVAVFDAINPSAHVDQKRLLEWCETPIIDEVTGEIIYPNIELLRIMKRCMMKGLDPRPEIEAYLAARRPAALISNNLANVPQVSSGATALVEGINLLDRIENKEAAALESAAMLQRHDLPDTRPTPHEGVYWQSKYLQDKIMKVSDFTHTQRVWLGLMSYPEDTEIIITLKIPVEGQSNTTAP